MADFEIFRSHDIAILSSATSLYNLRKVFYSRFDRIISAEKPRNAPIITVTAAPPAGKTATKGPSQLSGSVSALWLAKSVWLADLHDAA